MSAAHPFPEEPRLEDLYRYGLLDKESEVEFNELLELVSTTCDCPIAAISFIDRDRLWFKASKGLPPSETSRASEFCARTTLESDILHVSDTRTDERFRHDSLVTDEPGIRFYAGAPIRSSKGYRLGAVCVIDREPRNLDVKELRTLRFVAGQIGKMLELRLKNKVLRQQAEDRLRTDRALLQQTLDEQEAERMSISMELHEDIAQTLASSKFFLELAEDNESNRMDLVRRSREMITKTIRQIRELSFTLMPTTLNDFNLRDLLDRLLRGFTHEAGIAVDFRYEGHVSVGQQRAMGIYRIAEDVIRSATPGLASQLEMRVLACSDLNVSIRLEGAELDGAALERKIFSRIDALGGTLSGTRKGNILEWLMTLPRREEKSVEVA